jgi:hypothetical protein
LTASGDAAPGKLAIEIDGPRHDFFEVSGLLDITATTLSISNLGGGVTGSRYIIASYGSLKGSFSGISGLPANYIIDYHFDDGATMNNIALIDSSTLTPFEIWIIGSALGGGDAAFEADPNGDGLANGLAFFLGARDAMVNAIDLLPTASLVEDSVVYRFDRADTASQIGFFAEYSSDLSRWTAAKDNVDGVSIKLDESGSPDQITVTLPRTLAETAALFIRLAVTE